ncbi:hypothetical protein DKG71_30135 [Streptomyces sp. NEAU-S7GS2]|nr:hypothetical protein DKG71_30135 [Streptomyces sp. NEAU-S7GS2]
MEPLGQAPDGVTFGHATIMPGAGSREPGAGSREPGAGSREPGAFGAGFGAGFGAEQGVAAVNRAGAAPVGSGGSRRSPGWRRRGR